MHFGHQIMDDKEQWWQNWTSAGNIRLFQIHKRYSNFHRSTQYCSIFLVQEPWGYAWWALQYGYADQQYLSLNSFPYQKHWCHSDLLPTGAAAQLVHYLVKSRLDYCNNLLLRIPEYNIQRLQRTHNIAARVIARPDRHHDIDEVLESLHWLPVKYRILYKVRMLVYKCLNNLALEYLSSLLVPYTQEHYFKRYIDYVKPQYWNLTFPGLIPVCSIDQGRGTRLQGVKYQSENRMAGHAANEYGGCMNIIIQFELS